MLKHYTFHVYCVLRDEVIHSPTMWQNLIITNLSINHASISSINVFSVSTAGNIQCINQYIFMCSESQNMKKQGQWKKKKNCCHFSGKANPVTTHLRSFVVIRESAAWTCFSWSPEWVWLDFNRTDWTLGWHKNNKVSGTQTNCAQ